VHIRTVYIDVGFAFGFRVQNVIRALRLGGGQGLPFLLGGFLGSTLRRGRGPFHGPMGGFKPGGFKPGGSKPGGFKPDGGMGRGGGAGRKF